MRARWRVLGTAACLALCTAPGAAHAAVPSWTTYHHDGARTGIDPDSTSPLPPGQIHQDWQSAALDGTVWGQPLVYGSRVYAVTENDTVYALDASTGQVVWHDHLATAVDAGQLCGGDIDPTVGITSTPVIDPTTGRIYVVADTWDGTNAASIAHELFALNLSDGSVAMGPMPVDPPGSTHADQLQRASLALDGSKLIIGYGGNDSDCGNYHGWLVAVPEAGGPLQTFEVDSQPGDSQGAIWGSGNAPAIDSAGDIWVSTGNGSSPSFDYSESVIKLDTNLNSLDWWAPSDWSYLDQNDVDLGSTMPLLLPDGLVFEIGKQGVGFLLSATSLGHTGGPPLYSQSVCSGSWGGGIYYGGVIYVACADGMHALKLDTTNDTFAALSTWTVDSNAISPPIEAGGLIWSADWQGSNLYGLDPITGAETFVSGNLNGFEHFASPSAGGGQLFVANQTTGSGDQITAFQVATPPPASPTAMTLSSSANPVPAGQPVTFTAAVSPTPDAGTVSFADGGIQIGGCGAVPISPGSPQATCTTTLSGAGQHSIAAGYSGDAYYAASSSSVGEVVTQSTSSVGPPPPSGGPPPPSGSSPPVPARPPPAPVITHLRVTVSHGRVTVHLVLSEPSKLIVTISGRHGVLRLAGRHGRNTLKLGTRPLARGRYRLTIIAVSAAGVRSRRYVARFRLRAQR